MINLMALCRTPGPVHPRLSCSGRVLSRPQSPRCVSPRLSEHRGITSARSALEELAAVFGAHPRCCWPPLPQGCIACSCSTWCLPAAPGPSCRAAFQAVGPGCGLVHGVIQHHGPDAAAPCTACHRQISLCNVSLNTSTAIQHTDCCTHFCITRRLAEGAPSHHPSL